MPFFFRKSFGPKGLRVNLSKTGIGVSTGVKGMRVSIRPKGAYVNVGAKGIYYRKKIGDGYMPSRPSGDQSAGGAPPPQPISPGSVLPPITTADPSQLVSVDQAGVIQSLNEIAGKVEVWKILLPFGSIVSLILAFVHPVAFLVMLAVTALVTIVVFLAERESHSYRMQYDLDAQGKVVWKAVSDGVAWLRSSQMVWRVDAAAAGWDYKTQSNADHIVNRSTVNRGVTSPKVIQSNIKPEILDCNGLQLIFLPDALYVFGNKAFGTVAYRELRVTSGETSFVESGSVPRDAQQIGTTWKYVNRDGGPDRRFADNYEIPIMHYGEVHLSSPQGLNVFLKTSSVQAAKGFESCMSYAAAQTSGRGVKSTAPPPVASPT